MFLQKMLDAVIIKKRELPNLMSGSPPWQRNNQFTCAAAGYIAA